MSAFRDYAWPSNLNSVQVNQVNYMYIYIQFTGSTSPPLSPWARFWYVIFQISRDLHADTAQQTQGYTTNAVNQGIQPMLF